MWRGKRPSPGYWTSSKLGPHKRQGELFSMLYVTECSDSEAPGRDDAMPEAMQRDRRFMTDLLAVIASDDTEGRQIAAAKTLAEAYAADLMAGIDPAHAKQRLLAIHNAVIAEQNQRRSHSRHWRIFEAAELVFGDVKINVRRSASAVRTAS